MPSGLMKFRIYPYKMHSVSAKALTRELAGLRLQQDSTSYRPKENHIIINWGNSHYPFWNTRIQNDFLNCTEAVQNACNKLTTFQLLKEVNVPTPDWTTLVTETFPWLEQGHKVFCRTSLTGHSGQGIVLASNIEDLVDAPLYTKYTKCKYEYRVHVMNGNIIDFVQKKKRTGVEANPYIRSHSHGWVFTREHVELPECIEETALKAIAALGLDFGAVDMGYNVRNNQAYAYEINTAPALEGTTLLKYVTAFKDNYQHDNS